MLSTKPNPIQPQNQILTLQVLASIASLDGTLPLPRVRPDAAITTNNSETLRHLAIKATLKPCPLQPRHADTAKPSERREQTRVLRRRDPPVWRSGAVPPQFSPSPLAILGVNLAPICADCTDLAGYTVSSCLFSVSEAADTSWHGRGHRFDPDQVQAITLQYQVFTDTTQPPSTARVEGLTSSSRKSEFLVRSPRATPSGYQQPESY
jgi:hypothetical protein